MRNVSRVKMQSSTTGLSSFDLASSGSLYRQLRDEMASGDRVRYIAASASDWEEGIGVLTYGTPDTLSRDTIIRSSTGAKINWPAGTRDIFLDPLPGTVPVLAQAGAYTVTAQDHGAMIRFTGSSGATFSLATAASMGDAFSVEVYNSGTADVTIDPSGAETINGASTLVISAGRGALIRCSGAAWFAHPTGTPATASVVADGRNVIVQYASAATATVTADELVLKDASGAVYLASSVNVTANIASSGANGLDTGAEGSSTWYYIWVIYNGTTVASLLSTSSTSPTMPSGYTYKALVGAVRNDGSSNFIRFWQHDRRCAIATQNIFSAQAGVTSYTSQSISAAVPPIARFASGSAGCSSSSSGFVTAIAGDANGVGAQYQGSTVGSVSVDSYYGAGVFSDVPLMTSQTLYWKARNTTAEYRLDVSGYLI